MHRLPEIISRFSFRGKYLGWEVNTKGHINDTYLLDYQQENKTVRYVLQRINSTVFPDPTRVMENIQLVTDHMHKKIAARGGNPKREALGLILTTDGKPFFKSSDGEYWRAYHFITGAHTYDRVEDPRHFYESGRTFGQFQYLLSDFPAERLHTTLEGFHDTPKRFGDLMAAVQADLVGRANNVQAEIAFISERKGNTSVIMDLIMTGEIPLRVTHNDTKLNNIMIDDLTGEGICVLDLDTVMPGSALYDFGDAIRFGASTAKEDEANLDLVSLDLDLFTEFSKGYLSVAKNFLCPVELGHLAFSTKLITLEQGARFLEDYLNGDIYYKVEYPQQNLYRTRTQLKLVEDMENKLPKMEQIISRLLHQGR